MNAFSGRSSRASALVGVWIAGCAASLVALWSVDGPPVSLPPSGRAEYADWLSSGQALDTFAGLGRVSATIALGYLLLAALLQVAVCTWGSAGLRKRVGRFNPAPVAALVAVAVAGTGSLAGASPSSAPGPDPIPPPTMVMVEPDLPVEEDLPVEPPEVSAEPEVSVEPEVPVDVDLPALETPTLTVVVQPGDHLWSIAENRVQLALGATASESDVRSYWIALIETNADRLVEPGNADLIVPGQELVLPA